MSYCVNCGVKLAKSEKKCPLCQTRVINPKNIKNEPILPTYPKAIETFNKPKIDWHYATKLSSLILIFLGLIVVLCDIFTTKSISWSIYVIGSIVYFSCQLTFINKKNIYTSLIIELIASELFMLMIAGLNNGYHWYLYLVMPSIFVVGIYVIIFIWLMKRKKINTIRVTAIGCFMCAGALAIIEILIDLYKNNHIALSWSIYAFLPLAIIAIVIFAISYNKKLLDAIKQRMFI